MKFAKRLTQACDESPLVPEQRFPVPTYKLGKRVVADRAVVEAFFASRRAEGLKAVTRR